MVKLLGKLLVAVVLDFAIFLGGIFLYGMYLTKDLGQYDRLYLIYNKVMAQTGQTQDYVPLKIIDSDEVNAFTDGKRVVLYTGIIKSAKNDDELALIMGHEIAHVMLRHLSHKQFDSSDLEVSVAESNADKLGAFYMMKAGYDICTAREYWKRAEQEEGNYQGSTHPNYSYRYDELNINCGS